MWPWDDEMQAFKALSYGDKLRVSGSLTRGEAPGDPRMAAAAVELAEGYQRQSRASSMLMRWYPVFAFLCFGYISVSASARGDHWMLIFFALTVAVSFVQLRFSPATRPKNMARGLEASRRVVASGH